MIQSYSGIPIGGSLLVLLMFAGAAVAQEIQAEDETVLEAGLSNRLLQQEVITPSRQPRSVSESSRPIYVITRAEIQQQGARTVQEALKYLPGIRSDGTTGTQLGALSGQFMRGLRTAQVLVLLDGRPLNDTAGGGFDLSTLTTDTVERIEVSPGGGSTLYGSDAVGGVINIVTLPPGDTPETLVRAGLGSYGFDEQGILSRGTAGELGWVLSYQRYQALQNFPFRISDTGAGGIRENANVTYDNLALKLVVEQERQRFGFSTFFTNKDLGVPGGFPGVNLTARSFTHNLHSDLTWEIQLDPTSQLLWRVYADQLNLGDTNFGFFQATNQTYGSQLQHTWQINPAITLITGVDYRTTSAQTRQDGAVNYDQTVSQTALLARADWRASEQVLVNLGIRQDFNSLANGSATSPAAGIRWQLAAGTALRVNYARSFRVPTFLDLFFPGFDNPNLKPERGESLDLGLDQQLGSDALLRLTWSTSRLQDGIVFVFNPPITSPQNIQEISNTTWEIALDWEFSPGWLFRANATFNDPRIQADSNSPGTVGKELPFTGADTYNLALIYRDPQNWYAGVYLRHVGGFFTNTANTIALPGYTTVDLKAGIPLAAGVTVDVGVDNLFDQQYLLGRFAAFPTGFSDFPAMGTTVRAGLRATF